MNVCLRHRYIRTDRGKNEGVGKIEKDGWNKVDDLFSTQLHSSSCAPRVFAYLTVMQITNEITGIDDRCGRGR